MYNGHWFLGNILLSEVDWNDADMSVPQPGEMSGDSHIDSQSIDTTSPPNNNKDVVTIDIPKSPTQDILSYVETKAKTSRDPNAILRGLKGLVQMKLASNPQKSLEIAKLLASNKDPLVRQVAQRFIQYLMTT